MPSPPSRDTHAQDDRHPRGRPPDAAGEPGQEQPALEDRQPSADQDHVSVTDVESEQVSEHADAEDLEGPGRQQGVEHTEETDGEDGRDS